MSPFTGRINQITPYIWEIPQSYKRGMRVPTRIYASRKLLDKMRTDRTLEQITNVATLPGIRKFSIALGDAHEGYGFCIGGVAAFDIEEGGIISSGGVGYDINCGVRLLTTTLEEKDVRPLLSRLLESLFRNVPSGVGSRGKLRLSINELERAVVEGVEWAIDRGYGRPEDAKHIEEEGRMEGADPSFVSDRAKQRGAPQLGTLGSGNHFLEIDVVNQIFDESIAKKFGITHVGQIVVLIHTGSRGFGHQIASDYVRIMERAMHRYGIHPPDRELACVPFKSKEGEEYFKAMKCAVNYAFLNRQLITHWVRESFREVFGKRDEELGLNLLYDVCHNIAKVEEHKVDGSRKTVVVHRKGATRAFPPGHPLIPPDYRDTGQPVLIPGSMGTSSWVLIGTEKAMELSFGSTAHGAGRYMSRKAATRKYWGSQVKSDLEKRGILVMAASVRVIAEEAPGAYKSADEVVEAAHNAGLSKKVVRLTPIGVAKG